MARKSNKRLKAISDKRARKAAAVANYDDPSKAPSKYRVRKAARLRGAPMAARPNAPWWMTSQVFLQPARPFIPNHGEES